MDYLASITFQNLALSRNPVVVLVDPAVLPGNASRVDLRYYLGVHLQKSFQSSQFMDLPLQEASEKPVPDNSTSSPGAYFEIQTRLDDELSATPPVFSDRGISVCPNLTRQYYYTDSCFNGDIEIRKGTSTTNWVMRSRLAMRHYSMYKDVFFSQHIGGNTASKGGRFLTWQPDNKLVREDQPERLYFLTNFMPSPKSLLLRVRIQYSDNTYGETYTASQVDNVTPMTVYSIPVGFTELGLATKPKSVINYEVWLSNENEQRVSEFRIFRVDRFFYENVRYLIFQNSLGGYDTIRCVGSSTESLSVTRQVLERFTDYDYLPTVSDVLINNVTGERQLTLNLGNWLNDEYRRYLEDLLLSEDFYTVDQEAFIPIVPGFTQLITQSVDEWPIERSLPFTYANSTNGFSQLPNILPPTRATSWRQWSVSCELDANGLRTGKQIVNELVKYFTDNGENVRPLITKANVAGTEGYIPPWQTDGCKVTPFLNTVITGPSQLKRSNCANGQVGGTWSITVPAGSYGSELSIADAQAKAQVAFNALDTQANADQNGTCVPAVNIRLGVNNMCQGDSQGYFGGLYWPIVAILENNAELIPNTTWSATIRYSETTLPASTRNIDVRCIHTISPYGRYRIRIPSKNLQSEPLIGSQTYRFANLQINWGDADLIVIVEPA